MSIAARPRNAVYLEGANGTGSAISAYLGVRGGPAAISLPAGVTSAGFGVTAEDIADGERGNVQVGGVAVATAGEQITANDVAAGCRVYATTTGKFLKWSPAQGVNQAVWGLAISPASGDGKLFELLLGVGGIGQGA